MRTFHRIDERRMRLASPPEAEKRLAVSESIAVIAGLSVLSWGAVILLAVGLGTVL
jgi:hypothetical protein